MAKKTFTGVEQLEPGMQVAVAAEVVEDTPDGVIVKIDGIGKCSVTLKVKRGSQIPSRFKKSEPKPRRT